MLRSRAIDEVEFSDGGGGVKNQFSMIQTCCLYSMKDHIQHVLLPF
jgi:hypothetical protein